MMAIVLSAMAFSGVAANAQTAPSSVSGPHDPGVRGGPAGAGGPLPGLGTPEINYFNAALARFREVDSVSGTVNDAPAGTLNGSGLGPRFNLNSCAGCHAQPAAGGTSPPTNPQVAVAGLDGAANSVPSFISLHGPVREARFINNPDSTPDGGVHDLFVIAGRSDATGCTITQPNFAQAISQKNIIFRIPTPLFGAGLIENTPDISLENDAASAASRRAVAGVAGHFNRTPNEGTGAVSPGTFNHSANDGTISRFGWKAQNKSLLMFAGEAYNVEQGATNEIFPNERDDTAGCQFNPLPEDPTNLADTGISNSPASDYSSDIVNFAAFMRLSAPPQPAPPTASTTRGAAAFSSIGCNLCHIAQHTTARSLTAGLNNVTYSPYSDFEVHHMGTGLQDQIAQGQATGDEFRTAPLWGVGQRIFFLHDGRTRDLLQAIQAHASSGSEANTVIGKFNALSASSKQDILNFLRSL
jgi:CxxC motif-containing protein (DUF1111 family)